MTSNEAPAAQLIPRDNARPGAPWIKTTVHAISWLLVSPLILGWHLSVLLLPGRRESMYQGFSQCVSLVPGLPGDYLRIAFYHATLRECSRNARVSFGTIVSNPETILRDHVYVGAFCNIGCVDIGADTLIGSNVTILGGRTQHIIDRLDIPVGQQGGVYSLVRIGRDVWIGNGAIVSDHIGDQAVVGAGSVVVKPVEPRAIVVGNPARVVGTRGGSVASE